MVTSYSLLHGGNLLLFYLDLCIGEGLLELALQNKGLIISKKALSLNVTPLSLSHGFNLI